MDTTMQLALTELFSRLRNTFAQELDNYENSERRDLYPEREVEARVKRDFCSAALFELRSWYAPHGSSRGEDMLQHWTEITLYNADGAGRRARWETAKGGAVEVAPDGRERRSPEITAEYLGALAEIRDTDACANWYTDEALEGQGPRSEDIDWSGFEHPEDGQ